MGKKMERLQTEGLRPVLLLGQDASKEREDTRRTTANSLKGGKEG